MEKRIILVDDSEMDLFINRKTMELAGVTDPIVDFHSPVEALQYLHAQRNNIGMEVILFLDLNMPEMDGLSFLSAYCQMGGSLAKHTRVLILSSTTNPAVIKNALSYPLVDKFVVKPLTIAKSQAIFAQSGTSQVIR
jgi:two-component system, NarL family, nitrate/nitrite response regulator NarL